MIILIIILIIKIIIIILIKACYPFQINGKDTKYNVGKPQIYIYDIKKNLVSSSQIIRLVIMYE